VYSVFKLAIMCVLVYNLTLVCIASKYCKHDFNTFSESYKFVLALNLIMLYNMHANKSALKHVLKIYVCALF